MLRASFIAAIVLASATLTQAKDIVLPLNEREQTALRELLDLATKAGGLTSAPAAVHFANKMQALQQQAEQPPLPPSDQPK